ncbi:response regulator (plasmid) [Pseudomonas sp. HR96]|uniref:response regulator n=1 Tax=Pseudomonas sp. HR96 TaxID=1027966 RepID=UPI002A75313E|nr:response regulator [Pseudomonas sp. HR96]WPP02472.1 response regulator [Pseudomonas sp. HR96]
MATLLIVDDEYVITEILECIFEDEDYTVVKTVSAVKVLDCVRPDLVITDFMMPMMNGVELAIAIRAPPSSINCQLS